MCDVGKIDVPVNDDGKIDTVQLFWNAIVTRLNPVKCKQMCENVYIEGDDSGWLIDFIENVIEDPECNWELHVDPDIAVNCGNELDQLCNTWLKSLMGADA